jgi:hypothetical protein
MPTAANSPKAWTGGRGEMAKERNPTAVVTQVWATGQAISSMVAAASTAGSSSGRPRRIAA